MGLLDNFFAEKNRPYVMGLMSALAQAGQPGPYPRKIGPALAQGMSQGMQLQSQMNQQKMQQQLLDIKLAEARQKQSQAATNKTQWDRLLQWRKMGGKDMAGNPVPLESVLPQSMQEHALKKQIESMYAAPKDRRIEQAADGFKYYPDTGERVFPNAQAAPGKPLSSIGRLQRDLKSGLISQEQYVQGIAAMNKPLVDMSGTDKFWDERGKTVAKQVDAREQAGLTALKSMPQLREMKNLLALGLKTGFGADWEKSARLIGKRLGMGVDEMQLNGAELFSSMSNQLIGPLVKQLGTNPTDRDLQFIVEAAPTLSKTPEGNSLIVATMERKYMRDERLHQWQAEYLNKPDADYKSLGQYLAEKMSRDPLFTSSDLKEALERMRKAGKLQTAFDGLTPEQKNLFEMYNLTPPGGK